MPRLKITWAEFVGYALRGISKDYPQITDYTLKGTAFVKERSYEGEGDIVEQPDYVYIEMPH